MQEFHHKLITLNVTFYVKKFPLLILLRIGIHTYSDISVSFPAAHAFIHWCFLMLQKLGVCSMLKGTAKVGVERVQTAKPYLSTSHIPISVGGEKERI